MTLFRYITPTIIALAMLAACNRNAAVEQEQQAEVEEQHTILYGIIADDYKVENGEIGRGETQGMQPR